MLTTMHNIFQKVYISIGTNIGNLTKNIHTAIKYIESIDNVILNACSPIYHTEPQGNAELSWFQNQVIRLSVKNMTPIQLLDIFLNIEHKMGRIHTSVQKKEYEARIIDLDILLFGKETMHNDYLSLPHPKMLERAFVLVPLSDIEPTLGLPGGFTPLEALKKLTYKVVNKFIYQ